MNEPLVSVVMVVCNVERFLAEAIESILAQTFGDFEFIILDFGSSDRSESITLSYAAKDSRIKVHKVGNCGLAEARNSGCSLAKGRYIAIMDADDVALPMRLQLEVEFAERHPEVGLVGGATEWIDAEGRMIDVHVHPTDINEIKTEDHAIKSELQTRCSFCQSTVLMRNEVFVQVGGYRAAFFVTHDYDLWMRIADRFPVANLRHVVLKYRIHPYQISIRKQRSQTLFKLAAQASAKARRRGEPDPLDGVKDIKTETLVALGIEEAKQQNEVVLECYQWIRSMSLAGEYAAARKMAVETLRSNLKYIDRRQIAELELTLAWLYWKEKKPLSTLFAIGRAVMTRPILIGFPARPLLRRLRLVGKGVEV